MKFPTQPEPTEWEKLRKHFLLVDAKAEMKKAIHAWVQRYLKEQAEQRQKEAETRQAAIEAAKAEQARLSDDDGVNPQPNNDEGEVNGNDEI